MPAWRKVDITLWAEYSRQEYTGNGFYIHQFEAGISFLLLLFSCFLIRRYQLKFVSWQVYAATLFSAFGIVITCFTAPLMFGLSKPGNDAVLLQQAFDRINYPGAYRAVARVLTFGFCLWAMGRCFVIKYVRV